MPEPIELHPPPDGTTTALMVSILRGHIADFVQEHDGVIDNQDIEYLHRMRVASRRIRTVLDLFAECFPHRSLRRWEKAIRRITRDLADARDTDVQIDFIVGHIKSLKDAALRPGPARLLLRLRQKRTREQKNIVKELKRLAHEGVIQEMLDFLREQSAEVLLKQPDEFSATSRTRAFSAIHAKLDDFLTHRQVIHDPARAEELHEMRIAAKHLRYALECFEPWYGKDLKPALRTVKHIQEHLGNIHDRDVWIQSLDQFLADEKQAAEKFYGHTKTHRLLVPGILALAESCRASRQAQFEEFIRLWDSTLSDQLWDSVLELLRQAIHPSDKRIDPSPHANEEGAHEQES